MRRYDIPPTCAKPIDAFSLLLVGSEDSTTRSTRHHTHSASRAALVSCQSDSRAARAKVSALSVRPTDGEYPTITSLSDTTHATLGTVTSSSEKLDP